MKAKTKTMIMSAAVVLLLLTGGVQATPYIVENWIPAEYWGYLPEWVISSMGERGDFLPEVAASTVSEVNAADLIAFEPTAEPMAEPTAVPTNTAEPTATAVVAEAAGEAAGESAAETAVEEPTATLPPPTETPSPTPEPTAEPLPAAFRLPNLDGTMIEAQKFNNCGPTNLTLVLRSYGFDADQLDVASFLKPNSQDRNVSPWQKSDYVNDQTSLRSLTRANGTQELLKELLVAGFPVVIEKGYQPPESPSASGWYGHYLTLFGYDDAKAEYYTLDTFLGPFEERDVEEGYTLADGRPYSYEYVAEYWQQFNYTFYVVYRPEQEAQVYEILGEELLDDVTMWQNAAVRAQEEIAADGEDAFAWFNLGTALTRLGEITGDPEGRYYANGATAFDKALSIGLPSRMLWYQHGPYVAYMKTERYQDMLDLAEATLADPGGRNVEETYYYQGHARSFLGDLDGAAASFAQALKLNEYFYPAQLNLDYVNSIRN